MRDAQLALRNRPFARRAATVASGTGATDLELVRRHDATPLWRWFPFEAPSALLSFVATLDNEGWVSAPSPRCPRVPRATRRRHVLGCLAVRHDLCSRVSAGGSSDLGGGAYPLQTIDILALAALVWVVTSVVRAARARLDQARPKSE